MTEAAVATSAPTQAAPAATETPAVEVVKETREQGLAEAPEPAKEDPQDNNVSDEYLSDEEWARLSKKKRKLKIDDEEAEMTLEEIARNTGINKRVTQRGQEAAAKEKAAQEQQARMQAFFNEMREDPNRAFELLEKLGHDPDQIAIARARQAYEWTQKSEIEKRAILAERQAMALKDQIERDKRAKIESEQDAKMKAIETEIETDIKETLKVIDLPTDVVNVERIAQALTFLYNRDGKKPTPQQVREFVLPVLEQDALRFVRSMSPEQFEKFLGEEYLDKYMAHRVKRAEKNLPYAPSKRTSAKDDSTAPKKKIGVNEWFKTL